MYLNRVLRVFAAVLLSLCFFDSTFAEFNDAAVFVGRITAFDSKLAIVHGTMRAAVGPLRSKLLVTSDSGQSWKETLSAQEGSNVVAVSFVDRHNVFAAVEWTMEGPGWAVRIFSSTDSGNSWTERPPVQKPDYVFSLDGFVMGKSLGLLSLYGDSYTRPGRQEISFVTTDGGMSWKESKIKRLPSSICCRTNISRGADGSLWKLECEDDGVVKVYQCSSMDLPWELSLVK